MFAVRPPFSAAGVTIASDPVRLGMPQLGPRGLSEAWLLGELGDRHWQGLAAHLGRRTSDLTDADGHRVYAAFRAIHMRNLDLARAREDGIFQVTTTLARASRTQVLSSHVLSLDGQDAGTVVMVSAFIRREVAGRNARVCRACIAGLDELPHAILPDGVLQPAPPRAGPREAMAGEVTFTPCPEEDFNGAGFLYFPAYVAFANRAGLEVLGRSAPGATLRERRVAFFGNVDEGARIVVAVHAPRPASGGQAHRFCISEAGTARPLALVEALIG